MERYTCPRALLPVIESALAAEGYTSEAPLHRVVDGTRITVMTRGGAVIAFHEDLARDMLDIHVYPSGEAGGLTVFDQLSRLVSAPPGRRRAR